MDKIRRLNHVTDKNTAMQRYPVAYLSDEENAEMWRDICRTKPSDHISLKTKDDEALCELWKKGCSLEKGRIPSDLFFAGKVALHDCKIIVDETDQPGGLVCEYRVTVFPDYQDRIREAEGLPAYVAAIVLEQGGRSTFIPIMVTEGVDYIGIGACGHHNVPAAHLEESKKHATKALEKQITGDQMKAYMAYLGALSYYGFVMKRRDIKYINSALMAVKPMVELETSDLDSHEFLLNCPDGTYDLRQGMNGRRDHDSADYITMITAFAPGDDGKELWLDSINRTFQGDTELIDYVQQTVGLCAIGDVYQEALTISYGVGSNGKSTFWNSIAGAMGTYSGMISADALTVGCRRNVKPELAEVKGKRILIAAELEEGMRLSTSIVKQLSSTDEIEGEKKYKDPFKFKPTHTLVLYTNHLPKVGAMDTGIWRRLIVIPFNATIMGNGEIKNYSKYLMDNAGPYIVKWIIEGAQKAINANFKLTLPKCVKEAIEKYKADNDWMSHFLDECCELGDGYEEKSGELYAAYRSYCARSGEFTRSTTEFYKSLEQRGFTRHRTSKSRLVRGLRLADSEE